MPDPVLTRAIDALSSGHDLSADAAAEVLAVIMAGDASETQIAGLLIALRTKGETVEEIAGLARTMRALRHARDDEPRRRSSTRPAPAAGARPSTSRRRRR